MPFRSAYPDIDIPTIDLWSFLFDRPKTCFRATQVPNDKVVVIDPAKNREFTHGQLKSLTEQFASALQSQLRCQKGHCVSIFAPNCWEYVVATLGTVGAGAVISPASYAFSVEELTYQLQDSGAKVLVTHVSLLETALKATEACGIAQENVIVIGELGTTQSGGIRTFDSFISKGFSKHFKVPKIDAKKDVAVLPYSSGTTGRPKGVQLSHYNLVANILQTWTGDNNGDMNAPVAEDVFIGFLPFSHIYAINIFILTGTFGGRTMVILPKFDLEAFCELNQRYRATRGYIVPPVVTALAKSPVVDKYDLSSLAKNGCMSAAAPLSANLIDTVYTRLGVPVTQAYGMTECSPSLTILHTSDWRSKGSVGPLVPNMEARLVGTDGLDAPPGAEGEIWVRGPNVFLGYHNKPAATAEATTPNGWYQTGDVGRRDPKTGYFFITDRVKELIKYNGYQIPPAELEGVLTSHPKVADAAVIGIWMEEGQTEVPMASVILQEGVVASEGLEREIQGFVGERVAYYKKLRGGVRFVEVIPKSASGKILRRVLRKEVEDEKKRVMAKL